MRDVLDMKVVKWLHLQLYVILDMDSLDRQEEVVIASNHDRHHVLNHNDNLLNMIVKAAMVLTVLSFLSGL